MTITNIEGGQVQVTDLTEAHRQALMYVGMHWATKKAKNKGEDVMYFADAHAKWEHEYLQLRKLLMKDAKFNHTIQNKSGIGLPIAVQITDGNVTMCYDQDYKGAFASAINGKTEQELRDFIAEHFPNSFLTKPHEPVNLLGIG